MSEQKQTTKYCPECGNEKLWEFPYSNYKVCDLWSKHEDGHVKIIPWYLEDKQERKWK